jgi:asparagine synthase (glutamine-hydrolysing)
MCGIAGSFQIDLARPQRAAGLTRPACIAHRGPDDSGIYINGRAVLGHRRLSIIDTSAAGHQPFTDKGAATPSCSTARSSTSRNCARA